MTKGTTTPTTTLIMTLRTIVIIPDTIPTMFQFLAVWAARLAPSRSPVFQAESTWEERKRGKRGKRREGMSKCEGDCASLGVNMKVSLPSPLPGGYRWVQWGHIKSSTRPCSERRAAGSFLASLQSGCTWVSLPAVSASPNSWGTIWTVMIHHSCLCPVTSHHTSTS